MAYKTALEIEAALLQDRPWSGIHFDYKKCYDQIYWELVEFLATSMGMHPRIHIPMQNMTQGVHRRFKSGQGLGGKWLSTNGLLQGCPLSVVTLNLVVQVWAKTLEIEIPDIIVRAFADDTAVATDSAALLQQATDITATFAETTHQELHPSKTITWAVGPEEFRADVKRTTVQGKSLTFSKYFRDLGAQISTVPRPQLGCVGKRRQAALADARKCTTLPVQFHTKANVVAAKSGCKSLYGCEITAMSMSSRKAQRTAGVAGSWGRKSRLRNPKLVMCYLAPRPQS